VREAPIAVLSARPGGVRAPCFVLIKPPAARLRRRVHALNLRLGGGDAPQACEGPGRGDDRCKAEQRCPQRPSLVADTPLPHVTHQVIERVSGASPYPTLASRGADGEQPTAPNCAERLGTALNYPERDALTCGPSYSFWSSRCSVMIHTEELNEVGTDVRISRCRSSSLLAEPRRIRPR
jgi:hypothetical protein